MKKREYLFYPRSVVNDLWTWPQSGCNHKGTALHGIVATRCNILSNWVLARQVSLDYKRPAAKPFSCNSIQWESFCFFCQMHFWCENQNFAWGILHLVFYCFNGVITLLICLIQKRQYLSKTKEDIQKKKKTSFFILESFSNKQQCVLFFIGTSRPMKTPSVEYEAKIE